MSNSTVTFSDVFKDKFLSGFSLATQNLTLPNILISLAIAFALGLLIYFIYKKTYRGVLYSHSFNISLIMLCMVTTLIIMCISSAPALSLGMVGALSIVRFRTAVKDPLDLLYLFWAITAGITTGAGMYLLAASASAVMIGALALLSRWQTAGRIYVAVLHYQGEKPGDEIVRALGRNRYAVKSKTLRGEAVEMAVEVCCRDDVRDVTDRLQEIEGVFNY